MRKTFAAGGRDSSGTEPHGVPLGLALAIPVHAEPRHIAYRDDATTFLGRVVEANDGSLQVARDNKAPTEVARKAIIGRVVVATR